MRAKLVGLSFSRNGTQLLTLELDGDFRDQYDELNGQPLEVDLRRWRKRRSLDANAYFWVLISRLAARLNIPKTQIYRDMVREIGGNSETVCVLEQAADKLRMGWEHNGLGWVTDLLPSKLPGCVNMVLYYGSSTYDSAQMSRLIDLVVEECRDQGIETLSPEELGRMTEEWRKT